MSRACSNVRHPSWPPPVMKIALSVSFKTLLGA